jgi:hypothetical protein
MGFTAWCNKHAENDMNNGVDGSRYDKEQYTICYLRFKKSCERNPLRTLNQTMDWLKSPAWKEELADIPMKPASFFNHVLKQIYKDGNLVNREYYDYTVENLLEPGEDIKEFTTRVITDAEKRRLQKNEDKRQEWEADQASMEAHDGVD